MDSLENDMGRGNFMKLGVIAVGTLVVGGGVYAYRENQQAQETPFIYSPADAGLGCGTATFAPLTGIGDIEIILPGNVEWVWQAGNTFLGSSDDTFEAKKSLRVDSYSLNRLDLPADSKARDAILSQFITVYDIRFQVPRLGKTIVLASAKAPIMRGGDPDFKSAPEARVFAMAIGGQELKKMTITQSPLCETQTAGHVADILQSIGDRIDRHVPLTPDDNILTCAIVPKYLYADVKKALRSGDHLHDVLEKIAEIQNNTGVDVQALYAHRYTPFGDELEEKVPMALVGDILAVHQCESGQVLALFRPRQTSYLKDKYIPEYESLRDNAKIVPMNPIWIDVEDIQMDISQQIFEDQNKATVQAQKTARAEGTNVVQNTQEPDLLQVTVDALRPTATQTHTTTPTPRFTDTPTMTIAPTQAYTDVPNYTGWEGTPESSLLFSPPLSEDPGLSPVVEDIVNVLGSILCVLVPSLAGGAIYNAFSKAKRERDELLAAHQRVEQIENAYQDKPSLPPEVRDEEPVLIKQVELNPDGKIQLQQKIQSMYIVLNDLRTRGQDKPGQPDYLLFLRCKETDDNLRKQFDALLKSIE